ncbi:hypothetical protein MC885_016169 [Smutsia gigantea]|nr:hypothetical protein MC885_016169 [Smutsia gigantea]
MRILRQDGCHSVASRYPEELAAAVVVAARGRAKRVHHPHPLASLPNYGFHALAVIVFARSRRRRRGRQRSSSACANREDGGRRRRRQQ